jgi:hypothetical protein
MTIQYVPLWELSSLSGTSVRRWFCHVTSFVLDLTCCNLNAVISSAIMRQQCSNTRLGGTSFPTRQYCLVMIATCRRCMRLVPRVPHRVGFVGLRVTFRIAPRVALRVCGSFSGSSDRPLCCIVCRLCKFVPSGWNLMSVQASLQLLRGSLGWSTSKSPGSSPSSRATLRSPRCTELASVNFR